MKVVIVGRGAAAMAACRTLATNRARGQDIAVTLIAEEGEPYSKVALPSYVKGELDRTQVLLPSFYEGAREIVGRATSIDRQQRLVQVSTVHGMERVAYDYLILCTGARPTARFGQTFWTLDDAEGALAAISSSTRVGVLGGGFVGLHLAQALLRRAGMITLIEAEGHLLPGRLPMRAAEFVETQMIRSGVDVVLSSRVTSSVKTDAGSDVTLASKSGEKTLHFDTLFDCTGARPDVSLARDSGLEVTFHGIIVDRFQRSSDERVLAAGDCAAVEHETGNPRSAGLWHEAEQQGMIAAFIVLGIRSEHKPCNGWNTFRIPCDDGYMTGVSFGDFGFRKSSEIRESGSPELGDYRYAVVREGVVTAYLALGDPRGAGALMGTGIGVRDVPRPDVWPSSFDSWLYGPAVVVPEKTRVIVRGVNDADR